MTLIKAVFLTLLVSMILYIIVFILPTALFG